MPDGSMRDLQYAILADSAYPTLDNIVATPDLLRPLRKKGAMVRRSIEWSTHEIRFWKRITCKDQAKVKNGLVYLEFKIACILSNVKIILQGKTEMGNVFNVPPPSLDEYLARAAGPAALL
jgi:hypothetical protein